MTLVREVLHFLARRGRLVLVAGLLTGMLFESVAVFLKDYIPEMAVGLLFLAAFRVGPKAALGAARDFRLAIVLVGVLQILIPAILFLVFQLSGWNGVLPSALVLLAAGASVSASPHLAIMCGHEPAPALRMLVMGTALLPVTIVPVLWLMPQFGDVLSVLGPAFRLFLVIGISAAIAFVIRSRFFLDMNAGTLRSVDGLSSVFLFLIVVGLMSAVAPAFWQDMRLFLITLAAAFAVNFGLQILFFILLGGENYTQERVPTSIVAGNRNMALFLTALPANVTDPMLLFIGCYQIPMYLTPILLGRLYRSARQSTDEENMT